MVCFFRANLLDEAMNGVCALDDATLIALLNWNTLVYFDVASARYSRCSVNATARSLSTA